jgi:hypothetical protein
MTRVTVVADSRDVASYRQGDIGQPFKAAILDDRWVLFCPICRRMTTAYPYEMIIKHTDGTVSTVQPLHCHGKDTFRQFVIEHNAVRWVKP